MGPHIEQEQVLFPGSLRISQDSGISNNFPWPTAVEMNPQTSLSYEQSIPSDVHRSDGFEAISDILTAALALVFDPTTLDIEFDHSCLDGLDGQLLYFPTDAFAAVCWAEAIGSPSQPMRDQSRPRLRHDALRHEQALVESSDESETDSDTCRTFNDDQTFTNHKPDNSGVFVVPIMEPSLMNAKSFLHDLPLSDPFISLGRHFTPPNPQESIGSFPVFNYHRTKSSRISTFCSNLPARIMKTSYHPPT